MLKISNKFTIQESFAISAGAGSGKTYTLSRRYINAVLGFDFFVENKNQSNYIAHKAKNKADVSEIVTMTYTEAAALEMKERIFELMQKVIDFDSLNPKNGDYESIEMGMDGLSTTEKNYVKETLQNALNNSNNAFISTIHSFCLNTITANSDIAEVDSKLEIIQDDEKKKLLDEIRFEIFSSDESETLELFSSFNKFKANQIIEKYTTDSQFRMSFDEFLLSPIDEQTYRAMIKELVPVPQVSSELMDEVLSAKDAQAREIWLHDYLKNFDTFEAQVWKNASASQDKAPVLKKDSLLKEFVATAQKELPQIYTLGFDEEKEKEYLANLIHIHDMLKKIHIRYTEQLKAEQKTDFDSIIALTAKIVGDVQHNYKYIMVDEFQDTNALQNKIVKKISENKNLFIVGDAKQSIYSFQGAELEVFNTAVSEHATVAMNKNFRSDKKILSFVNDVFKELFEQTGDEETLISSNFKASFTKDDELLANSEEDGKVEFLISKDVDHHFSEGVQYKDIAKFIKGISSGKISGYEDIKKKMDANEKAIGIVFDSKSKMLQLKKELNLLGLECKVSATEDFYATREINDIFLVLKSASFLKLPLERLTAKQRYMIAGALRSSAMRYNEAEILELLNGDISKLQEIFSFVIEKLQSLQISSLIKFVVDETELYDAYLYLGDIAQRAANIEKLIEQAIMFESSAKSDIYTYLKDLEHSIYFNQDSKEDEAFYKSDNVESIEICTIHSTKGLAYPMVILAQSEKALHANATGDMGLSFNTFSLYEKGKKKAKPYSAVGFKIDGYEPLIYRILKEVSKKKHEAEKKRLLYVALTRAEQRLVIAGSIYETKDGVRLGEYNYLRWMTKCAFGIEVDILNEATFNDKINFIDKSEFESISGTLITPQSYELVDFSEKDVVFRTNTKTIASDNKSHIVNENTSKQAELGTTIHSILERYWEKLEDETVLTKIYNKYALFEVYEQEKVKQYIENFKLTNVYKMLKSGVEYKFELELNRFENAKQIQGIIDLVYFDTTQDGWVIVDFKSNNIQDVKDLKKFAVENGYDKQLKTYKTLCESKGMKVVNTLLLFLDRGEEESFK